MIYLDDFEFENKIKAKYEYMKKFEDMQRKLNNIKNRIQSEGKNK